MGERIFVTGGTGAVGRPLVPLLVRAGHHVTVVARSEARAELVRSLGAEPARLHAYDARCLAAAMAGCDDVIDLTTNVPPLGRALTRRAFRQHDWLRDCGTAAVVEAAGRAQVTRVVRDSVAFAHADGGDALIDENWPMEPGEHLASAMAAERHVRQFEGDGVVLRFSLLYGPLSSHTRSAVHAARALRVSVVPGPGDAYASSLHHDDAAGAVLAALNLPAGTYEVGDDEPMRRRDLRQAQADALGVRRLRAMPGGLTRGATAEAQTRSQRVSAAKLKTASGWRPRFPSAREGWRAVAGDLA